jgi:nucleotide-binding universal stress UspA family protein
MASSCERIDSRVSDLAALVTAVTSSPTFRTFAVDPAMVTDTPDQYERECSAWARHCLAEVAAMAIAAGVPYHIVHDDPLGAIMDTAIKKRCDLIFMASRLQGLVGARARQQDHDGPHAYHNSDPGLPVMPVNDGGAVLA